MTAGLTESCNRGLELSSPTRVKAVVRRRGAPEIGDDADYSAQCTLKSLTVTYGCEVKPY